MEQGHQEREKPVYAFRKNTREEVRASLSTFKGKDYVDLRVFYTKEGGDAIPTGKGLTLSREMLEELEKAVSALRRACGRAA